MNLPNPIKVTEMMTQARVLREQLNRMEEQTFIEAESGAGIVHVRINGRKIILRLTIDPTVFGGPNADIEQLETLIAAAVNEAGCRVDEAMKSHVKTLVDLYETTGTPQ